MNRIYLIITGFLYILPVFGFGQEELTNSEGVFERGYIVTSQNDTLSGYILLSNLTQEQMFFTESLLEKTSVYQPAQLNGFFAGNTHYVSRESKFLEVIESGRISLYKGQALSFYFSTSASNGQTKAKESYKAIYYLEKNGYLLDMRRLKRKQFVPAMKKILTDCDKLSDRIGKDGYQYEDLVKIIDEYNDFIRLGLCDYQR